MTASVVLWIAYIVVVIEAGPCLNNQHCSDCDIVTGHCLTKCDTGYFDQKCASVCSKNCKNNTCMLLRNGNDGCTNGCVLGYQGISCNTPCHNPGDTCVTCPGGCDGGYCQLGSSCVSGCVNSSHGTGCHDKPAGPCKEKQHCSICDNTTGNCLTECATGYFDQNCSSVCSGNCKNKTCILSNTGSANCTDGCVQGYQGIGCNIPWDSPRDERETYIRIGLLASSSFSLCCVFVTIFTSVTTYLNRNREETRQEDEDDYLPNALAEERVAPDAFQHSNARYSEVNESDMGTVVVFLEERCSN